MFAAESTDGLCESAGEVEGGESNSVPVASRMTCSAAAGIITQDCVEDTEEQKQRLYASGGARDVVLSLWEPAVGEVGTEVGFCGRGETAEQVSEVGERIEAVLDRTGNQRQDCGSGASALFAADEDQLRRPMARPRRERSAALLSMASWPLSG